MALSRTTVGIAFAAMLLSTTSHASEISLANIVRSGSIADFELVAGDIAEALGTKRVGPGSSLGALGFDLSLEVSNTFLDEGSRAWQSTGGVVGSPLTSVQVQMRKGLPLGFEVGGTLTYMPSGDMWGLGMGLKYALVEGYRYVPDIGVRLSVSTALGNRDLNMIMVGADVVLSKSFGIGGSVALLPYAGYSLLYARATTNVVGYFEEGATSPSFNLLPISNIVRHRAALGLEVKVAWVSIGLEALVSGTTQTITTRVGVDF